MVVPTVLSPVVDGVLPDIIELRRELHRKPELSGQEEATAATVAEHLLSAGIGVRTGIGGHGVVAMVGEGEPCVALRADMDALPIQERTALPWSSRVPGVMHACGHDFHTAWLVGTALVLQQVGLPAGSAKLIFQPAEEALGGARQMIADGALTDPTVEAIYGAHVWPEYRAGVIGLRAGHNLAAADRFSVQVTGSGTHGATPHRGVDPIPVAAEMITALQTLVSRESDPMVPAVVSVCQVSGGTAFNIIPEAVSFGGTVRTVSEEDRQRLRAGIQRYCTAIAEAHSCMAVVDYELGVPPTVTDAALTASARSCIEGLSAEDVSVVEAKASMGAEDFAYYLEKCPGILLWVGCGPAEADLGKISLHDPCFVGDEGCLRAAMLSLSTIALAHLGRQTE